MSRHSYWFRYQSISGNNAALSSSLSILLSKSRAGFSGSFDEIENETIAVARRYGRVANEGGEIDAEQCVLHRDHHPAFEFVAGLMYARCVDENGLSFRFRDDPLDAEACCL